MRGMQNTTARPRVEELESRTTPTAALIAASEFLDNIGKSVSVLNDAGAVLTVQNAVDFPASGGSLFIETSRGVATVSYQSVANNVFSGLKVETNDPFGVGANDTQGTLLAKYASVFEATHKTLDIAIQNSTRLTSSTFPTGDVYATVTFGSLDNTFYYFDAATSKYVSPASSTKLNGTLLDFGPGGQATIKVPLVPTNGARIWFGIGVAAPLTIDSTSIIEPDPNGTQTPYDFAEFTLDATVADKDSVDDRHFIGLHLNTTQVDQFGIPMTLSGVNYATGANASFGSTLDITRQEVIGKFQSFVQKPANADFSVLLTPGTTANRIVSPAKYLSLAANVASPLMTYFDDEITKLFTSPPAGLSVVHDGVTYTATKGAVDGFNVLTFKSTGADQTSMHVYEPFFAQNDITATQSLKINAIKDTFNLTLLGVGTTADIDVVGITAASIEKALNDLLTSKGLATVTVAVSPSDPKVFNVAFGKVTPLLVPSPPAAATATYLSTRPSAPSWFPADQASVPASVMVFGSNGIFQDFAQQPGLDAAHQTILQHIEVWLNRALNRGVISLPFADWGDETKSYTTDAPKNLYAQFLHKELVDGQPIFEGDAANPNYGLTYAFSLDDDQSTSIVIGNKNAFTIALGPWLDPHDDSFIERLYLDLLKRKPGDYGLTVWGDLLAETGDRQEISQGVVSSLERFHDAVTDLYQTLLNRAPDAPGFEAFQTIYFQGKTIEDVKIIFYASPEYFAKLGGTNVKFVDAVFDDILGHDIDPADRTKFEQALAAGQSRAAVALVMFHSEEHRRVQVSDWYQSYLKRPAQSSDLSPWLAAFAGGADSEQVLSGILGSKEFYDMK